MQLGNWLATTFPNMYGAGANNLAGKTNAEVAAFYTTLFKRTTRSAAGRQVNSIGVTPRSRASARHGRGLAVVTRT